MYIAAKNALARARRDERGISLIEVMMSASILAVVLGAIFSLSETTAKLAPNDDERALVVDEARTALVRMTRDTREASTVSVADGGYTLAVQVGGVSVTYTCNVAHPSIAGRTRCTRSQGGATAVVFADHLLNSASGSPVFTLDGNYVRVNLRVATKGVRKDGHKHTVTFDDAAYARNVTP